MLENGLDACNCIRKCTRHGNCAECMRHHEKSRHPPYCKRVSARSGKREQGGRKNQG